MPSNQVLRDFSRGLTSPDAAVVAIAAALLMVAVGGVSVAAERFRRQIEAGTVDWRSMGDDFCRASVLAMRGAPRECDPAGQTIVLLGPSAMACWLPPDEEADAVGSAAAGRTIRVLAMCGTRQSLASSAALIDRFGSNFTGWFVVAVTRQQMACPRGASHAVRRRRDSQELGFHSDVQRRISSFLGHPQQVATGWELWDRPRFYYHALFKPALGTSARLWWLRPNPAPGVRQAASDSDAVGPLDLPLLDRHLAVLHDLAESLRGGGRARLALVETPWESDLVPGLKSPQQATDDAAYRRRMQAWSKDNDVPWITTPTTFAATSADFHDARHVGSPALRRRFLEVVVRELSAL